MVLQDELYGGTFNLVMRELERQGIEYTLAATNADAMIQATNGKTRVIYLESPTNPLLTVVDIQQVAEHARAQGVITVIDSTFASPINQNPLLLGIDVVIHSGTKYLSGHSDLCCGVALGSRELIKRVCATASNYGGSLNAGDCYLLERSLKTLQLRVAQQTTNAAVLAEFLDQLDEVANVFYPGLKRGAGYEIACQQMSGFGAMLSFQLKDHAVDAFTFQKNLSVIKPALSLGGVESTICSPAITSHRHLSEEERQAMGVTDGLLRLSVGIEDVADLKADVLGALKNDR